MDRPRILLADDHSLVLQGIRSLLETRYAVVGTAENGKALVEEALRLRPDLIVLDVSMPILNGIDAAKAIKKVLPCTKLIFLSMHASAVYLRRALEAGASGYVLKSGAAEELLSALERVRAGETYIAPAFGIGVIESVRDWARSPERAAPQLTERQRQMLQLVAEGRQNKEIAEILGVSVKTVEFHRARLMTKLGAHSVAELTRFAIGEGLIDGTVGSL